jgi:predicted transcriptional regulator
LKYRSRSDIVGEILKHAQEGKSKTKIMYEAYLSFTQLNEYLTILTANSMLYYDKKAKTYTTTTKGLEYLKQSAIMGDMLSINKPKKIDKTK